MNGLTAERSSLFVFVNTYSCFTGKRRQSLQSLELANLKQRFVDGWIWKSWWKVDFLSFRFWFKNCSFSVFTIFCVKMSIIKTKLTTFVAWFVVSDVMSRSEKFSVEVRQLWSDVSHFEVNDKRCTFLVLDFWESV